MSEREDDVWDVNEGVEGGTASLEGLAVAAAEVLGPAVDNIPPALPDVVTPPPPAKDPQDKASLPATNGFPLNILETPKSRKRRLDRQRAQARRAKAALNGRPSTSDAATTRVLPNEKQKKPRVPDFSANEFIRLWHVMVSEEGKDAMDRLLTGMTRQQVK